MNLRTFIEIATEKLNKVKINSARLDVKILVSDYFNYEFHDLILNEDRLIEKKDNDTLNLRINRRICGEPVAYIVGYKYFYKHKFFVNENVLIPRPETELLVEEALIWCEGKEKLKVLDMGAGTGCIGQSVLNEIKDGSLVSMDISKGATEVAKKNAEELLVAEDINFLTGDINNYPVDKYLGKFNLILANPPYIDETNGFVESNVKKYEPSVALFSGNDGFKDIISWTQRAASWLVPGGLYLMEFGDEQSEKVKEIFKQNNFFMDLSVHKDYSGLPRFIKAIK